MQARIKPPSMEDLTQMFQASGLKEKLLFTFLMIAVFRFCAQLPLYGINNEVFANLAAGNNIIGFLDLFSGGALGNVSIIALGIGPYITSSIIVQLLAVVIPHLEQLQKEEGEAGRRKLSQYTRIFTVVIAIFQSLVFLTFLTTQAPAALLIGNKAFFVFASTMILTAGSVFVMWLAELISERGLGNGGSLIIFCGILAGIPVYAQRTSQLVVNDSAMMFGLLVLLAIFFVTMVLIVIMQEAIRKVVIVNPRRQVGNKVYGGVDTHIPFKLNPGGVMPIIFAIAILLFPSTIVAVFEQMNVANPVLNKAISAMAAIVNPTGVTYYVIYFLLIFALTFFYASIMPNMQPKDIANNLKKYGSSIPGIKPGKPTAEALEKILSRTTFIGATALSCIALIPSLASYITNITTLQGIGATSLIIMVGVALDFINQIKTHLLARNYESFLKNG
ncbi:preprotein translocase subunit SecY [bacterium]|nr:preprotein translocase subunit SecY [bacterium]